MAMLGAPIQSRQSNQTMMGAPFRGGQYTQGNLTPGLYDRPALLAGQLTSGMVQNPAMAGISHVASGADVGQNPYLDATYQRAAGQLTDSWKNVGAPGMALDASAAGRTGGGLYAMMRNQGEHQLGQNLTDLSTGLYGGAYQNERANQMNALGLQAQTGQQDVNNRLAGAGLFGQGQDRAMQGIQLGQNLQNQQVNNFSQLTGVGNALQQAPWLAGTQYAGLLNSMPGVGGGMTTTSPNYSPSLFSQVLGGATGGASMGLGLSGGLAGWGGLGAGLGALGGLGGSDRRLKTDIRRIGKTDGGHAIYTFRYHGDPETRMGVMAQEVRQSQPDVVHQHKSGFLLVDYSKVA